MTVIIQRNSIPGRLNQHQPELTDAGQGPFSADIRLTDAAENNRSAGCRYCQGC